MTMTEAARYRGLRGAGLTRGQIRGRLAAGSLIRPFHDVYVDPATAVDEAARLRALFLRLPADALACRHTAARLHGFGEFVPPSPTVHIMLPAGRSRTRVRGVTVHEAALPAEPVLVKGVPCTTAARCAIDLARTCRRMDALPVIDGALRADTCTPDHLASELARHSGLRGICQVRQLVRLADPGAQCRQESQLRLVVIDGGLPRPQTQIRVLDDFERMRYVIDLGWEEQQVGAEYDGMSHLDRRRARHDRERHNWLAAQGWQMRYFTDQDLYRRPRHIVSVLRSALRLT
jgi:very-short-patch-repair endonuclease